MKATLLSWSKLKATTHYFKAFKLNDTNSGGVQKGQGRAWLLMKGTKKKSVMPEVGYEHGNMSGYQTGTNKEIRSYRVFVSLFLLLDSSVITVISEIPTSAPKS